MSMAHLSSVAIPVIAWNCWVAFVALIGNTLLFFTMMRAKDLRTTTGTLLTILSACEIIMSALYYGYVYTLLITTFYTRTECFWFTLPSQIIVQIIISLVTVIGIDRYLSLRCRLWYKRIVTFRYMGKFLIACLVCGAITIGIMWTSINDETVICHMLNVSTGLAKKVVNTVHVVNVLLAFILYIFLRFEVNENEGVQSVGNQLPITKSFQKLLFIYVFCYGLGAIMVFVSAAVYNYSFIPDNLVAAVDSLRVFASATPFFIMFRGSEAYKAELSYTIDYVAPNLLSKNANPESEKLNPDRDCEQGRSYNTIEALMVHD